MPLTYGYKAEDIVKENRVSWDEIEAIRTWNVTVKIPKLIDEQIVGFLIAYDRDLVRTKKTILEYFKMRTDGKKLFNDRNLENADMQLQLATLEYFVAPVRTNDNCIVVYHVYRDPAYWKYQMVEAMKLLLMTIDAALYEYPPAGLIMVFDLQGIVLKHLTRAKIVLKHLTRAKVSAIKTFLHYCQEGLPTKLCAVHVLNCVYFLDKVMAIAKPFMKKETYKMLHFHSSSMKLEEFHEKFIDKACLPSDYGGELPSNKDLHERNTKILADLKQYFDAEEELRTSFLKEHGKF